MTAAMSIASCSMGQDKPVLKTAPQEQNVQEAKEQKEPQKIEPEVAEEKGQEKEEEKEQSTPAPKIYYTGKAVVLTYHHISQKPVSGITIKPERFEDDLKMLKEGGFNVISLRYMIEAMQGEKKLPPNAVVITFDDGYESVYKYAYPLLKKYNMNASVFIITSWTESYEQSGRELNSLGPDEIREMYQSGRVDIQSHSHDGHDYIVKDEKGRSGGKLAFPAYYKTSGKYEDAESYSKRVVDDLSKSVPIIEKYTGSRPDILCFPFGHYSSRLVKLSQKAGFKYFVTTAYGVNRENSKNVMIKRIRSGDAKLNSQRLKLNIISCGQEKPVTY